MTTEYRFGEREIEEVLRTDGAVRYRYFVKRVADWDVVWSLRNADGWVLAATADGQEVAPFWPFEAFARRSATGAWRDTAPEAIPLDAFMQRWLPGLAADGRAVSVLPGPEDRGAVVDPLQLLEDIADEQAGLE